MQTLITIIHFVVSVFLILVVLLQSGRGGGMGAAFGGASSQIFGGRGAGNFLARLTTGAAVTFFLTSLTLSVLSSRHTSVVADSRAESPVEADTAADAAVDAGAEQGASAADAEASDGADVGAEGAAAEGDTGAEDGAPAMPGDEAATPAGAEGAAEAPSAEPPSEP